MKVNSFRNSKLTVGILGGSFNPPHPGHLYVSQVFLKTLQLDYVWWVVAKQNPLKVKNQYRSHQLRCDLAAKLIKHPRIIVTNIEKEVKSNYISDVLFYLKNKFPKIKFIWLMGADNLLQFNKWHNWQNIFRSFPIAVFDRGNDVYTSLKGESAIKFAKYKLPEHSLNRLTHKTPSWGMIRKLKSSYSSTKINSKE